MGTRLMDNLSTTDNVEAPIGELLQEIRQNGDLRRSEARELTGRLRDVSDAIAGALEDAGVWGDDVAFCLTDDWAEPHNGVNTERRARFIRPSERNAYRPSSRSDEFEKPYEKTKKVVLEMWEFTYAPELHPSARHVLRERERDGTVEVTPITARRVEYSTEYQKVFFSEGSVSKVGDPTSTYVPSVPVRSDEEREKASGALIRMRESDRVYLSSARVAQSGRNTRNPMVLIHSAYTSPFVPRKLAVDVAESLVDIVEGFSEYVEGLAIETQHARQGVDAAAQSIEEGDE